MNRIIQGDNLAILKSLPSASAELIYVDPPFNTGHRQVRPRMKAIRDLDGDRTGFGGHRYRTEHVAEPAAQFLDTFDDLVEFLRPRMEQAHRILTPTGSLFFHIDPREVHYCKIMLDQVFALDGGAGRACFQNEIIWAYDYGARSTKRWPAKHDNILWYTRHPERYTFDLNASDRIPYMAPKLVGPDKAARGKTPTDVWWHTIVSPTGKEKTGYPTQKPLGILDRIIRVHTSPGDRVLDFFAGSGTTGLSAQRNNRRFLLIDQNPQAIAIMQQRLGVEAEKPESSTPITADESIKTNRKRKKTKKDKEGNDA